MKKEPLSLSARIVISIYLFAAPLLLMIADVLHYKEHFVIAVIAFKLALVAFVLGAFGISHLLPDKTKYFGLVGSGLIVLGAITLSAISTADLFNLLLAEGGYGKAQIDTMQATLKNMNGLKAVYMPTGFAFPVGLFVLAIGIFKSRYTPNYIAYSMCAGALLFTVARFLNILTFLLLSEAILFIASASTGFFILKFRPQEKK